MAKENDNRKRQAPHQLPLTAPQKIEEVSAKNKSSKKEEELAADDISKSERLDRMERELWPELFDPNSPEYRRKPGETMAEYMEKLKKVPPKQHVYLEETPAPATDENMQKVLTGLEELKRQLPTRGDVKEGAEEGTTAAIERGRERYESEKEAKKAKAQFTSREAILKKFEEDHKSPDTSKHSMTSLLTGARKWLDFVEREGKLSPDQWDRALVNQYWQDLVNRGYKGGIYKPKYIRALYDHVQMVFKTVDRTWPMPKKSRPKVERRDVSKPTLKLEQIRAMIQAAKSDRLTNEESAFLALSTVYAMRPIELERVADEDINYENGTVFVKTAKGGEKRDQLLAPQIVSYLKKHKFGKSYADTYNERSSSAKMHKIYLSIERKVGIEHIEDFGWHSIRRAIETVLVPWNITVARIFTRWSPKGDIALDYVTKRLEFDQEVFSGPHPFLPLWGQ